MTFTRSVQIIKAFRPGVPIAELRFYQPGTLESSSLRFNTVYNGKIVELAIFTGLKTVQDINIWIEDSDGERFTLVQNLRLKPSVKRVDLLELLGGGEPLSVSPNAILGATLVTPERRATTDDITILGYADEVGETATAPGTSPDQEVYLTVPEQASDLFISTKETNRKIPWTASPRASDDVCYRIGDDITLSPDGKDITLPIGTFDIWYRIHFSTMEGYAVVAILDSDTLEPLNKSSVAVAEPGREPGKIREAIGRAVFFVTSPITISVGVEYADSTEDKRLSWWECWCHIQKR
ncbi:hypothetical protein QGP82_23665 [Leptothoe sp. LEGE 181152]|nr:hypothetical protein [Leptothoe sp. LEGE 181152]